MKTYEEAKQSIESLSICESDYASKLLDCIIVMASYKIYVDIAPDGIYQVTENISTEISPELLYMMINHQIIAPIKEIRTDAEILDVLVENGDFLKDMAITVMKELFTEESIRLATSSASPVIH